MQLKRRLPCMDRKVNLTKFVFWVRYDHKHKLKFRRTDAFSLGIHPPVRESGQIEDTPGLRVIGPKGEVDFRKGVNCSR